MKIFKYQCKCGHWDVTHQDRVLHEKKCRVMKKIKKDASDDG